MVDALTDRLAINEVVNNWVLWSDSGDWERFATVWHDDAWMTATWFQGPATEFQKARRAGFESGVSILHFLGGTTVEHTEASFGEQEGVAIADASGGNNNVSFVS